MDVSKRWALVTGASSGLGREFARSLARRGCHVVLVARRREPMEQLAAELDISSLTALTHLYSTRMAARGTGHILLVASLAAYQPDPLLAVYGAAKHYVLAFGIALHVELAPKVRVTVVSPGLMDTEFNQVSGFQPKASLKPSVVSPSKVAEAGLNAMFAGKSSVVVGKINRFAAFSNRFTSRHLQAKLTYRMSK